MRFAAAHKVTTYLMVLAAWGAAALGDGGDPLLLLALPILLATWWLEPPRISPERIARWQVAWNIATVLLFALTILSILGGQAAIPAGIRFLLFLLTNKLASRRAARDYQQIYVISFLLLVAATTVNTELSFAFFFVLFGLFATWALILFHLRREMEENYLLRHSDTASEKVEVARILNSKRIVNRQFFAGTSLVSGAIFAGAFGLFLFFPRVGFGMLSSQRRNGLSMAGFSDGVTLGGHGVIKDNSAVVMRVEVSGALAGRSAPNQHWRGVAFDRYSRGRWSRSNGAASTHIAFDDKRGYVISEHTMNAGPFSELQRKIHDPATMRQRIYLEPLDSAALFAAGNPIAFEPQKLFSPRGERLMRGGLNGEVQYVRTAGIAYTAYSDPERPPRALLEAARDVESASRLRPYLTLPRELPDRVVELARLITRGARSPLEKAERIESYLRSNYTYTRVLDTDDNAEPLDYFLFERKRGHCEYFSSAMAVLLRAVGVPTRNVNGFYGGEWNEYGRYIAVRAGDAHSWLEVYFDTAGWVMFDPTPPAARDVLGKGATGIRARMARWVDTLRLKWFKWVIEYDLTRQLSLFRKLRDAIDFRSIGAGIRKAFTAPKQFVTSNKRALSITIALIGAAAALWILRKRARQPAQIERKLQRSIVHNHPLVMQFRETVKTLEKRGFPRIPSATAREFATSLLQKKAPGAYLFAELTDRYERRRFGQLSANETDGEPHALDQIAPPPATEDEAKSRALSDEQWLERQRPHLQVIGEPTPAAGQSKISQVAPDRRE